MGWVRLPYLRQEPPQFYWNANVGGNPFTSSRLLESSNINRSAVVLRAPRAGKLKRVHWLFVSAAQWPSNPVRWHVSPLTGNPAIPNVALDHAFRDDSSGGPASFPSYYISPDLTLDGTPTGGFYNLAADEYFAIQLSVPAGLSVGDNVASGGWGVINGFGLTKYDNISYERVNTTYGLGPSGNTQGIALEYDDGVITKVSQPLHTRGIIGNVTSPAERGNLIKVALPVRAVGVFVSMSNTPNVGMEVRIYSSEGGAPLGTVAIQEAQRHSHSNLGGLWKLPSSIVLQAGKSYRVVVSPTPSALINLNRFEYLSSQFRALDWELDGYEVQRTDRPDKAIENTWTETATEVAQIWPVIDAIDPVKGRSTISLAGVRNVIQRLKGERGIVQRLKGARP